MVAPVSSMRRSSFRHQGDSAYVGEKIATWTEADLIAALIWESKLWPCCNSFWSKKAWNPCKRSRRYRRLAKFFFVSGPRWFKKTSNSWLLVGLAEAEVEAAEEASMVNVGGGLSNPISVWECEDAIAISNRPRNTNCTAGDESFRGSEGQWGQMVMKTVDWERPLRPFLVYALYTPCAKWPIKSNATLTLFPGLFSVFLCIWFPAANAIKVKKKTRCTSPNAVKLKDAVRNHITGLNYYFQLCLFFSFLSQIKQKMRAILALWF